MIAIIKGSGANIASVQFALERLGKQSILTTDKDLIRCASHVILPGVGSAKQAMSQLAKMQLIDTIVNLSQPLLGICLGMQLLFEHSKEGNVDCLGVLPGTIRLLSKLAKKSIEPLAKNSNLIIPHMGWNQLQLRPSVLTTGITNNSYVYFVHSYAAAVSANTLATTHYGVDFSAMVHYKNFYGVQFHPERSGIVGEQILRNFLSIENEYIPSN